MTKQVRIENACNSDFKITVEVWDKTIEGDKLYTTMPLDYPTSLLETYITSTRFIVIKESGIRDK